MRGLLITHKGMEDIAAKELVELGGSNAVEHEGCVTFTVPDQQTLLMVAYRAQSANNVSILLNFFEYQDIIRDFEKNVKKINLEEWFDVNKSFSVRCRKETDRGPPTPELEKQFSSAIIEHIKKTKNYKQLVNLTQPDVPLFMYVTKRTCFVGIDIAGFDLSKRSYRIFTHPSAIKGTIAYGMIRLADYAPKKSLLDCYAASGTIPIEAALFSSQRSPHYFTKEKFLFHRLCIFEDSMKVLNKVDKKIRETPLSVLNLDDSAKHIAFAKKNSKIAGVSKQIDFSRMNLDWLDTKLRKNSVDVIVTKVPHFHRDREKHYKELFYQAEFILKKNGILTILGPADMVSLAKEYNFKLKKERTLFSGQARHMVFVFQKQ